MDTKKQLNPEQLKAIKHKTGPLLIIAGAGTGKTTVIAERIKFLIESKLADPAEILALTFTEKAAKEMEERVDTALPYGYTQMWISTFHSFCDRVLRREALHIGLTPKYKLMTEAESVQLIRNHLFKFELNYFRPLGNPNKFISGILQHFSRLQDEDVSPSDYVAWANSKFKNQKSKIEEEKLEIDKWEELAGVFKMYSEVKVKEGLFDFGDLIIQTLNLFRQRKNILEQYQKQFKYILVDEFQDTNYAQNELVKLLAGKHDPPAQAG
ncbi:MAG: UvrD-helicase domain-containing protein, partial [Candidatus Microgenomates bacterium]